MSKLISSYDEAVREFLNDLGVKDQMIVSVSLNIDCTPSPRLIVEIYVSADDLENIKKFISKFELKDTVEVVEEGSEVV